MSHRSRTSSVQDGEIHGVNNALLLLSVVVTIALAIGVSVWSRTHELFSPGELAPIQVVEAKPLPITPAPVVIPKPTTREHVLVRGDTLTRLARNTCDTVEDLAKRNGLGVNDIIYAGNSITLKVVEHCSPESAKAIAFPEKFPSHKRAGASREKSFHPGSGVVSDRHQKTVKRSHAPRDRGCAQVGSRVSGFEARVIARAECVREKYGADIREAIATIDDRLTENEVIAVMLYESKGDPRAISKAKSPCFGLMQLQGPTARQYGVKRVFDSRDNIFGGVRVLSDYTFRYARGDRDRGLVSYNIGPNHDLLKWKSFDPSRFSYVREVKRILRVLEADTV